MFISEVQKTFDQELESWQGSITIREHSEFGPNHEPLLTKFLLRPGRQDQLVVSISGTHGAEAYIGSEVQRRIINQLNKTAPSDLQPTVLLIHNFNSYGSAWVRRGNHLNIDLNRNAWADTPPINPEFKKFNSLLSAKHSLNFIFSFAKLFPFLLSRGFSAVSNIVASGQSDDPNSLFFSGTQESQETQFLGHFLASNFNPKKIYVLDIHTGLGSFAQESLILEPATQVDEAHRIESFFKTKLINETTPGFYRANGLLGNRFLRALPNSELFYLTQEFGTRNFIKVLKVLAKENVMWNSEKSMNSERVQPMLDCFFPAEASWRQTVTTIGVNRFFELLEYVKQTSTNS